MGKRGLTLGKYAPAAQRPSNYAKGVKFVALLYDAGSPEEHVDFLLAQLDMPPIARTSASGRKL